MFMGEGYSPTSIIQYLLQLITRDIRMQVSMEVIKFLLHIWTGWLTMVY